MEDETNKTVNTDEIQSNNKPWQFKPGQSGNPAGKPKGAKHFATLFKELLQEQVDILDKSTGKKQRMTMLKAMALSMAQQAMRGNVKAFSAVADRLDGKPQNYLDITSDGESFINPDNKKKIDEAIFEYLTGKRSIEVPVKKKLLVNKEK